MPESEEKNSLEPKKYFGWFTDENTIKYLKKNRLWIFLILGFFLVAIFVALIVRTVYLFTSDKNPAILSSLDPFSIITGGFGILFSWIIFLYVKQETEKKDTQSRSRIDELNKSVIKVDGLLRDYSSIVPIPGLRNRLAAIKDIYNHCFSTE